MAFFEKLRTYAEMRRVVTAFAEPLSPITFLIIKGDPGVGKTNTFRKQVTDAFVLECNVTPFGFYMALYANRFAEVVILDDVDTLATSPIGINLLKAVAQSDRIKTLGWNTKAADRQGIPRTFSIQARVLMFCNVLPGRGANFDACLDRAMTYQFQPTAGEVQDEVRHWMDGGETATPISAAVFDFIGLNLHRIAKPTFRDYVRGSQAEQAGLDWRTSLLARWEENPKRVAAAEIVRLALSGDPHYQTADQRATTFESWGHGCRSTYMTYQQQVLQAMGRARI